MSDTAVSLLAPFLNNAGASVIMIVFMFLWHKRATARDKQFFETLQAINASLLECMSKLAK
jgi:ABC-type transport system involved in cytochrome bd biosynthesis fused ATPase/permease subunit